MKNWIALVIVGLLVSACASREHNDKTAMREMQQGAQLATEVMREFSSLSTLLKANPDRFVSGKGDLPCERHDGQLWKIEGSDEREVISCSWGSEVVIAHGGDDQINTGWGDDALHGGAGNDTLEGDNGNEVIYGGPGNDIITGSWGDEVINGGPGDDQISTSWGNAVILFGNNWGHDTLDVHCGGTMAVLIFSKEIKKNDLVWSKNVLEDTRTQSKITFKNSTKCLNIVHSKERFL